MLNSKPSSDAGPDRRNFVSSVASLVIGGLLGVFPLVTGLVALVNPLYSRRGLPRKAESQSGAGPEDYTRICSLAALAVDDPPQMFQVVGDKLDAWNYTPQQDIGTVFVRRTEENAVTVFNATCPHAGCTVSCDGHVFNCPCHNSSFNLDGTKRESDSGRENPSPRDLDKLVVDETKLTTEGEVWIKFQNFYTGRAEPKPKG